MTRSTCRSNWASPTEGSIDLFEFDSTFTIDLEAGQKVNVRVSTPTGDPEVVITAPGQSYADGTVLSDSDTGLYGTDIDEEFTADGAGTYTLTLEGWGDAAMPYEMEISAAKGDCPAPSGFVLHTRGPNPLCAARKRGTGGRQPGCTSGCTGTPCDVGPRSSGSGSGLLLCR